MSPLDGRRSDEQGAGLSANTLTALAAVDAIIDDFGHHRRDAYFARFSADATFLFYTHPHRVDSRAAYERLWGSWEQDNGFHVHSCVSRNRRIQVFGQSAVFTHDVDTVLTLDGVRATVAERESIVLERRDNAWLCVHEHLSART